MKFRSPWGRRNPEKTGLKPPRPEVLAVRTFLVDLHNSADPRDREDLRWGWTLLKKLHEGEPSIQLTPQEVLWLAANDSVVGPDIVEDYKEFLLLLAQQEQGYDLEYTDPDLRIAEELRLPDIPGTEFPRVFYGKALWGKKYNPSREKGWGSAWLDLSEPELVLFMVQEIEAEGGSITDKDLQDIARNDPALSRSLRKVLSQRRKPRGNGKALVNPDLRGRRPVFPREGLMQLRDAAVTQFPRDPRQATVQFVDKATTSGMEPTGGEVLWFQRNDPYLGKYLKSVMVARAEAQSAYMNWDPQEGQWYYEDGQKRALLNPTQTEQLLKQVEKTPGWEVIRRRGGHIKLVGPAGQGVFMSSTPSDVRAYKEQLADLRRAGLDLKPTRKKVLSSGADRFDRTQSYADIEDTLSLRMQDGSRRTLTDDEIELLIEVREGLRSLDSFRRIVVKRVKSELSRS